MRDKLARFLKAVRAMRLPTWQQVSQRCTDWFYTKSPAWAISFSVHLVILLIAALISGQMAGTTTSESPAFEMFPTDETADSEITRFELGQAPLEPSELSTETLTEWEAKPIAQAEQYNDDSPVFEERGGGVETGSETGAGLGFDLAASGLGPQLSGGGGVDTGLGTGLNFGKGGAGSGFGLRGSGHREAIPGVTKASERAVAAALNWFSRHQASDGSWNLTLLRGRGTRRTCTCAGPVIGEADAAATALGLLPFLGAGQTHLTKGPYQKNIKRAVEWLVTNQKPTGDISTGMPQQQMYSHGLATLALCEAYGMTQDSYVGHAAQRAVKFIESAQNKDGGWRYQHESADGDTSVFGWQMMALKSASMAGLEVDPEIFQNGKKWLDLVSRGNYNGTFCYVPGRVATPSMTGVGLLASQYLGAKRNDPQVSEATEYLLANMPTTDERDMYYWYYATLALHNVPGPQWDTWNRQMRRILIENQANSGCAEGSWSPEDDRWGHYGGRLMMTSLAALTLEVYYRYLPLYQLDTKEVLQPAREAEPEETPR